MESVLLLRAIAPLAAAGVLILAVLIAAPVVLYVIARWRAQRDGTGDAQLGLKFALHYFAMSAFQLGLAGVALLIYMVISPSSAGKASGYRAAIGFIIPAGIVLASHLALLKRTNDAAFPSVRRLFWGYNMIVTGLVAFVALVLGFQALFSKGSSGGLGHMAGSMVVIYGAAWALIGFKFGQLVLGDGTGTTHQQAPMPALQTPPAQPTHTGQTGLPPLGGGSYPPIEPPR